MLKRGPAAGKNKEILIALGLMDLGRWGCENEGSEEVGERPPEKAERKTRRLIVMEEEAEEALKTGGFGSWDVDLRVQMERKLSEIQ